MFGIGEVPKEATLLKFSMFFLKIVFQKNVNNMFFWKSEKNVFSNTDHYDVQHTDYRLWFAPSNVTKHKIINKQRCN